MVDGTGYEARLGDMQVLGKTGTAQVGANNSREVNWIIALNEEDGKLYLVVVETDTDEGTEPKTAILRGLVKQEDYSVALNASSGAADGDGAGSGE